MDNDLDGFVDCADTDCLAAPACQPTDSPTSVPTPPVALVINGNSCPSEWVRFFDPDPTLSCDPGTDPDGATCKAAKIPAQPPFPSLPIPLAWCTYAAPGPKKCVRCVTLSTARRTNHILILIYTRADCGDAQAHFKAELFRDWGFAAARARAEALKTVASRR